MDEYKWSSYKDYISNNNKGITDIDFVLNLLDNNRNNAIYKFIQYNGMVDKEHSDAEYEFEAKLNDEDACNCIKRVLDIENVLEIQNYKKRERNEAIYRISQIIGISSAQMVRLLGLNQRTIQRIIKEYKEKKES